MTRNLTRRTEVLAALMRDPDGRHYGYDLWKSTGIRSGALYPILHRLFDEGWLADGWEEVDRSAKQRPPRRYYRLTDEGRARAAEELAEARRRLEGGTT